MKITVLTKPGSRRNQVEKLPTGEYRVHVAAPAHDGKANQALVRLLADHFERPVSCVRIVLGHGAKRKVVEILDG
jgi:uncharacterized protein (TIGR00251 family)